MNFKGGLLTTIGLNFFSFLCKTFAENYSIDLNWYKFVCVLEREKLEAVERLSTMLQGMVCAVVVKWKWK